MHTLVTILGKGRDDPTTECRRVRYRFEDGTVRDTASFGLALIEQLEPERLVVIGTSGSQCGVFLEQIAVEGEEEENRLQLFDLEASAAVKQSLLDGLVSLMSCAVGCDVLPRLTPYGKEESEQRAILDTIAEAVPPGEVSFDLTHAFRHLGMLGLISAFFLERVGRVTVKGLWYGALDMTRGGITPVLRLDGLLAIQRWVDALDRYDATGDYGVFAPLLMADGVAGDKARYLGEAAFHERTFNVRDARRKLQTFLPVLDAPLAGASGLFQEKLRGRLDSAKERDLHEHRRRLASVYLKRRDYVRAAVLAWEALISRGCAAKGPNIDDYGEDGDRAQAEALMRTSLREQGKSWGDSPHSRLKNLRNALAHGSPPKSRKLQKVLSDPDKLHETLEDDIEHTLG